MPSIEWNKRWGSRNFHKPEPYGFEWGDPEDPSDPRSPGKLHKVKEMMDQYVNPRKSVLEIGCGGGRWTNFLLPAKRVYLVELNVEFFQYLRHRFPDHVSKFVFLETNGKELPIKDGIIDFAFSFGCFVHCEMDVIDSYLSELYRVLRPNGKAMLQYADRNKQCVESFSKTDSNMMLKAVSKFKIDHHDTTSLRHSNVIVITKPVKIF